MMLPGFLAVDGLRHLEWFAAKELYGLLFVDECGAPFRRSTAADSPPYPKRLEDHLWDGP
ncbi:hypothetical protein [Actinacidiphila reveromycinica]|uniref:hypothetical protein n=1 Tax=Actinacidiphila reveromycinica TaxID=659352 RepID=UPI001922A436|nr:hypothetical protein [Streptomyces sp. SN-593]